MSLKPEEVEEIKKAMAAEDEYMDTVWLKKVLSEDLFMRTNAWDNPRPHQPRPGELATGVPYGATPGMKRK